MLNQNPRKLCDNSRRGIAILMALVVLGIILVIAYVYNFTSRQGKLASRRMFWGETTYFIADSVLEETFQYIRKNPQLMDQELLKNSGEWVKLDFQLKSAQLDTALGMSLDKSNIKVSARVILTNSILEFVDEKVGALEVVATVSNKSGIGIPLTRQITARRDFRYVTLFGSNFMQDYALMLKVKPLPRNQGDYDYNNLSIERTTASDVSMGKVFLGKLQGTNEAHYLGSERASQADERYLKEAGIVLNESMEFDKPDAFNQGAKSNFLLDILLYDQSIKQALKLGPDFDQNPYSLESARQNARKWINHFFILGAGEDRIKIEVETDQNPSVQSLPLRLESVVDKGFRIEDRVFREFKYSVKTQYVTDNDDVDKNFQNPFTVRHLANQAGMFESDPFSATTWSQFEGNPDIPPSGREEYLRVFLPYKNSLAYSQIFPNQQSLTWNEVKKHLMIQVSDNEQILNIDGIVGVAADEIVFDKKTIVKGQGVLLVMGKIIIQSGIERSNPAYDRLVLVSRAVGPSIGQGHIHIDTDQNIEAFLMCHSFVKNGSNGTLTSTRQNFYIHGGISLDKLNIFGIGNNNTVSYDPNFFLDSGLKLSLGVPVHYYKIYNNEKIDIEFDSKASE